MNISPMCGPHFFRRQRDRSFITFLRKISNYLSPIFHGSLRALFVIPFVCTLHASAPDKNQGSSNKKNDSKRNRQSTLEKEWVVDQKQLLLSATVARDAADAIIGRAKERGVFDDTMSRLSAVDHWIVFRVVWYVVAIGQYCKDSPDLEKFLESVDLLMGDVWVPPTISFVEDYQKNIDTLALKNADGIPFPPPDTRTVSELIKQVRVRLRK